MDKKQIAIDFAKSLNHSEIEKIILFGSVARGEDNEDSDIDILIVVPDSSNFEDSRSKIHGHVVDFILNENAVISPFIIQHKHYIENKNNSFYTTVEKEGF
ncbi:MAG: nucleotidyltransferase domain-containing protein [Methanobrevibacter sp.]|jgi:predicted nucleotidyltransferase|nr:nucleotidyltransferase domain-containing protein [Candidatus Methanoflexus mossambicus]